MSFSLRSASQPSNAAPWPKCYPTADKVRARSLSHAGSTFSGEHEHLPLPRAFRHCGDGEIAMIVSRK